MDKPLPYVSAAFFCEKVLRELDESLSVVRIADRVMYPAKGLEPGLRPAFSINGLLAVKSGPTTGKHMITIVAEAPSRKRMPMYEIPLELKGNDHGQNVILNMTIGAEEDGLYWFDVLFDGDLLTRIPLMIVPLPDQAPPGPLPNAEEPTAQARTPQE